MSRTTLIRLVRALPDPALSASPRVLGVDEFALRKGRRYRTLLVDVETRRPDDILEAARRARSPRGWLPGRERKGSGPSNLRETPSGADHIRAARCHVRSQDGVLTSLC